jgi:bifunctional DNA-binding transcriptional regulator/antitoxin component of YhaV-PrlF toxin-antitoxin module
MVKLQKRFAYTYKDKEHYKHQMTISEEVLEKLGWKEGTELDLLPKGDRLIVKRKEMVKT